MLSRMTDTPAEITGTDPKVTVMPTWYIGIDVCALADSERHMGHAILVEGYWRAYDAVHPNASHNGFLALGSFRNIAGALDAIENSVGIRESQFVLKTEAPFALVRVRLEPSEADRGEVSISEALLTD